METFLRLTGCSPLTKTTEKHLPALKCLLAAQKLDPKNEKLASMKQRLEKEIAAAEPAVTGAVADVLSEGLKELKL